MDYSAANTVLWDMVVQFGIISCSILAANMLRKKISFFRKLLMPTTVIAGFILLILRSVGILQMNTEMLEIITYHGIALGFIAMSLRTQSKDDKAVGTLTFAKSGALIVSTYLVQAIVGVLICLALAYTFMPTLFKAAGILLPMGYGQGPGQANNIGGTYESLGFAGGRSFGMSLAATGYLCACFVGVVFLNLLVKKRKVTRKAHQELVESVSVDTFQETTELPLNESLDRLSIQVILVLLCYFGTFLLTKGITMAMSMISPGLGNTVNGLLWGFNFIIGSLVAVIMKTMLRKLKNKNIIEYQYQNNYLLNRISGFAFDLMIVAGIASINFNDLSGLWIPFLTLAIVGAAATWFYLKFMCKKIYGDYYYEGLMSMYGMLTGTISSGVLLLREIDPEYKTPAANNMVVGSSFGIAFGFPVLILVGLAPKSDMMLYIVLASCFVYLGALLIFILKRFGKKSEA